MTTIENALNSLAEAAATELSKSQNPQGFEGQKKVTKDGGNVAKATREQLGSKLKCSAVSNKKASDYLPTAEKQTEAIDGK